MVHIIFHAEHTTLSGQLICVEEGGLIVESPEGKEWVTEDYSLETDEISRVNGDHVDGIVIDVFETIADAVELYQELLANSSYQFHTLIAKNALKELVG
jgi:hypothetical protein